MRLKDHRLEKVSIFYFVVIRPIENFLEALEVQIQTFLHLKGGVFFGGGFELFGPKRFEPAVMVVWP